MAFKKILLMGLLAGFAAFFNSASAAENEVKPCPPLPNKNQLRWQEMEFYAFIHFATNTFSNEEWGDGSKDPKYINGILKSWYAKGWRTPAVARGGGSLTGANVRVDRQAPSGNDILQRPARRPLRLKQEE